MQTTTIALDLASDGSRKPFVNPATSVARPLAGRYELVREIARGGMGVVYEGRHLVTGRVVAIKCVLDDSRQVALARLRLMQEAMVLGRVRHPCIVEVHDAGIDDRGAPYIAMEMLEGRTLDGILAARRTLQLDETLFIARHIGEALSTSHRRGVVHRDVKPSNIFVVKSAPGMEEIKLIDFGIAGVIGQSDTECAPPRITRAGDMLGTLDYVSPEQLERAHVLDPRSDQYALAAVLYECLSGNIPPLSVRLAGPAHMLDLRKLVPGISQGVVRAIETALMPKAKDRFADMDDFLAMLLRDAPKLGKLVIFSRGNPASIQGPAPAAEPTLSTRRRNVRAPYITPCRVVRADGSCIDARSEDISEGGILLLLPHASTPASAPFQTGATELVRIRFALPTTGLVATVVGAVRWVKDGRGRAALGVEFEGLESEARRSIATYVKHFGEAKSA